MTLIIAIILLVLAVGCRAISELANHGKLKWSKGYYGFWDEKSDYRKYKKNWDADPLGYERYPAPTTYYYKLFNLKYKEAFPLSATFLVWTTDGPHFFQMLFFTLLSLGITFLIGWNVWLFIGIMIATRLVNWAARKIFSK